MESNKSEKGAAPGVYSMEGRPGCWWTTALALKDGFEPPPRAYQTLWFLQNSQ